MFVCESLLEVQISWIRHSNTHQYVINAIVVFSWKHCLKKSLSTCSSLDSVVYGQMFRSEYWKSEGTNTEKIAFVNGFVSISLPLLVFINFPKSQRLKFASLYKMYQPTNTLGVSYYKRRCVLGGS